MIGPVPVPVISKSDDWFRSFLNSMIGPGIGPIFYGLGIGTSPCTGPMAWLLKI